MVGPLAVALEKLAQAARRHAQQRVAQVNGVPCERELGAQVGLDLGVRPARHVMGQPLLASIGQVVEPAGEVQVLFACLRIGKTHVLVDQLAIHHKTQVPADHGAFVAIDEGHAAVATVAQHRREKVATELVEMDLCFARRRSRRARNTHPPRHRR